MEVPENYEVSTQLPLPLFRVPFQSVPAVQGRSRLCYPISFTLAVVYLCFLTFLYWHRFSGSFSNPQLVGLIKCFVAHSELFQGFVAVLLLVVAVFAVVAVVIVPPKSANNFTVPSFLAASIIRLN